MPDLTPARDSVGFVDRDVDHDERIAAEIEAAYAERQAQLAASPTHQAYQQNSQRLTERDLAFNGLVGKHTFADPRVATPEQLGVAHALVGELAAQASGRPFTPAEEVQWQAALNTQASHYAAEEGRAR
jgi:hypothetical protein